MENAQDLSKPTGKIHRVNDDGSVPKDNPFVGKAGALPTIWSYGHRNPQGLAWDPVSGKLWESEHGPQGGDEINIIEPGKNYGWGVITMGVQNGITKRSEPGMEQPIVYYTPTIAPSGIVFYTGNQYPQWKNNLFVSALAGQQLRRLEVSGDKVTAQETLFTQFGRVHDVVQGPDGLLYVTFQQPGPADVGVDPGIGRSPGAGEVDDEVSLPSPLPTPKCASGFDSTSPALVVRRWAWACRCASPSRASCAAPGKPRGRRRSARRPRRRPSCRPKRR